MQTTVLLEAIPFGNYQSTNWIDGMTPTLMKRFLVVIWSHLAPIFMNETRSDGSQTIILTGKLHIVMYVYHMSYLCIYIDFLFVFTYLVCTYVYLKCLLTYLINGVHQTLFVFGLELNKSLQIQKNNYYVGAYVNLICTYLNQYQSTNQVQ